MIIQLYYFKISEWFYKFKSVYLGSDKVNKSFYKVRETYRSALGQQIIAAKVIKSNNHQMLFKIPATTLVLKRRDLLSKFSIEDIINIVGLATTEQAPIITKKISVSYKLYPLLAILFCTLLITSRLANAKLISVLGITMYAGTLLQPLLLTLNNLITEIYGYKKIRQIIWGSILCDVLLTCLIHITTLLTPSPYWHNQNQYSLILGYTPTCAMILISYCFAHFLSAYTLAKLKIIFEEKNLYTRILISFLVGIIAEALILGSTFYITATLSLISLLNIYALEFVCGTMIALFNLKIIKALKIKEETNSFDLDIDFTPFSLDTSY